MTDLSINDLNASRKGDREALAFELVAIAQKHGATVERRDEPAHKGYSSATICLRISCKGVGAMIDIDNLHGGKISLISWYNIEYPPRDFTPRFCRGVLDVGFKYTFHKATSFPGDWYSLAMALDGGLMLAARGEAFATT